MIFCAILSCRIRSPHSPSHQRAKRVEVEGGSQRSCETDGGEAQCGSLTPAIFSAGSRGRGTCALKRCGCRILFNSQVAAGAGGASWSGRRLEHKANNWQAQVRPGTAGVPPALLAVGLVVANSIGLSTIGLRGHDGGLSVWRLMFCLWWSPHPSRRLRGVPPSPAGLERG